MKQLNTSKDLELMMEFRNVFTDLWREFCKSKGYKAEVEE